MFTFSDQEHRARVRFFYDYAGWSEPPGRLACAEELAREEARLEVLEELGLATFEVGEELELETATDEQRARLEAGETVYLWARLEVAGETRAALGGIEVRAEEPLDGSGGYLRVVRAELAGEAFAELEEEAANAATCL